MGMLRGDGRRRHMNVRRAQTLKVLRELDEVESQVRLAHGTFNGEGSEVTRANLGQTLHGGIVRAPARGPWPIDIVHFAHPIERDGYANHVAGDDVKHLIGEASAVRDDGECRRLDVIRFAVGENAGACSLDTNWMQQRLAAMK